MRAARRRIVILMRAARRRIVILMRAKIAEDLLSYVASAKICTRWTRVSVVFSNPRRELNSSLL